MVVLPCSTTLLFLNIYQFGNYIKSGSTNVMIKNYIPMNDCELVKSINSISNKILVQTLVQLIKKCLLI